MKWSYGITTHPSRRDDLLPQTIASLKLGGFDKPRLFVDGARNDEAVWWEQKFGLEVTVRNPTIRTFGNWVMALWELYLREPNADRYAIFQDDMVTYKNLRQYLELSPLPDKGYLNLYTFPNNQKLFPKVGLTVRQEEGWRLSNQRGLGAVALVFTREVVTTLLASDHMAGRPQHATRGHKNIDGGIVDSFRKKGWREYVHNPSLVQHIGILSSMRNKQHPKAESFRGETFDALSLLGVPTPTPIEAAQHPEGPSDPNFVDAYTGTYVATQHSEAVQHPEDSDNGTGFP